MNTTLFGTTCVCLARVSTLSQDYEAQINALHKRAEQYGLIVIKDIATKESGFRSFNQKEGFQELVDFMEQNNCKIVLCTELSRLSRKKFLLEQIKQWLIDNEIQLFVDDINFQLFNDNHEVDMSTDIVFSVYAATAESEMKDKKKRMKRGMNELNRAGYSITGRVTFGYTRVLSDVKVKGKFRSTMIVNDKEAEQIRTIYNWYLNGIDGDITRCSISKIHEECIARGFEHYLHSKRNVNKCLKNELYTGHTKTKNKRKNAEYWSYGNKKALKYVDCGSEITIAPIISRDVYDEVQKKMKGVNQCMVATAPNVFADKSKKHITLLSKLVRCPGCGMFYIADYRIRLKNGVKYKQYSYRCSNHKSHGSYMMSMKTLDFSVWSFCKDNYEELGKYIQSLPEGNQTQDINLRISNIKNKKTEHEKELEDLGERFLLTKSVTDSKAIIDRFKKESNRIQKEIDNCNELLRKAEKALSDANKAETLSHKYNKTLQFIQNNKDELKKFITYIVREVVPLYHDTKYTVVQIIPKDNRMIRLTMDIEDYHTGITNNRLTQNTYLIINKRSFKQPKYAYISGPCYFNPVSKIFHLPNSDTGTLENATEDIDEVYFRQVKFVPLDIYEDDIPIETGIILENLNEKESSKDIV